MEILHGLIVVIVAGAAVIAFGLSVLVSYFLVQKIWPLLVGAGGGYVIWEYFDPDLGIAFAVLFAFVQIAWWHSRRKLRSEYLADPANTPQKHYNQEIYIPRYFDI